MISDARSAPTTLFARLDQLSELDRVVTFAARRVTIHPALFDDLRQEILIEFTRVPDVAQDPVKLGYTIASRVSLKFKAHYHGPLRLPDCAAANRARGASLELNTVDFGDSADLDVENAGEELESEADSSSEISQAEIEQVRSTLDTLSPALYRVARHIVRGQNIGFIAAAEGMTEASVRTVIHRIHHALEENRHV